MSDETEQLSFLNKDTHVDGQPIVCMGITFQNDEERREYFREELKKKIPELKKIDGFPIGKDEDIIALSDPPYYTACPNPWLNEFTIDWQKENARSGDNEVREPYTADVSEGKNDPIYTAHTYHTKVPYKAIMKYILHYTRPNEIVFDGFAGTGMTGVAANLCSNSQLIKDLGYEIQDDLILDENKNPISQVGSRKAILSDLSPAASFIAANYNAPVDTARFEKYFIDLIEQIEKKHQWLYKTNHSNKNTGLIGRINYVIWSDVFVCPSCSEDIVFYDAAFDKEKNVLKSKFNCPNCQVELTKERSKRAKTLIYDEFLNEHVEVSKQVPVMIYYIHEKKRFTKPLDKDDYEILEKVNQYKINTWLPTYKMPLGVNTNQPLVSHGFTHVHHFYTKRNLIVLSELLAEINNSKEFISVMRLAIQSIVSTLVSKLVRYNLGNRGNGVLNGTLYVSSLNAEPDVFKILKGKVKDFAKALKVQERNTIVSLQSGHSVKLADNSVDYIFTDPPFGANINYSELNFIWESWLKVHTNNYDEAIVNSVQNKGVHQYKQIMENCFKNYYRILKPGKWMTVEFSNSKASVWNAIQEAIQKAGFVIANVSALDKKQGSFKAVTTTTAVKQDLVISAYKPKQEIVEKMKSEVNTKESAWSFVQQHLGQLPVFLGQKGEAVVIAERTPRILFDRMVAFHVQNGIPVPLSSAEFQEEVSIRFVSRDGMIFLDSQIAEYDKKRILVKEFAELSLFVTDETSAIEWIRQQLMKKPQTRQDLHPTFMKEIQHIAKHEMLPELDDLLYQNFLRYDGDGSIPDQIASYLRKNYKDLRGLDNDDSKLKDKALNRWYVPDPNKQADLEKLRDKSLLREFDGYIEELEKSKKKLKQFRTEAVRAGFKKAWSDKDYKKIVTLGELLPESVIQEDDKLLMYFDNAQIRLGL